MSMRALFAVVVGAGVLCGCSGAPFSTKSSMNCSSAEQCKVPVTVPCTPGCMISVPYEFVHAKGFDVVWEMKNGAGQSYEFDRNKGIEFKTAAGREAFRCHVEASGARYKCMNVPNAPQGTYEYGVTLVGAPAVNPIDPWVVNR